MNYYYIDEYGARLSDALPHGSIACDDIPEVSEVSLLKDKKTGETVGVMTRFADGTRTKAVCDEQDKERFSLDFGLSICLCKRLMGSSKAYNKTMKQLRAKLPS